MATRSPDGAAARRTLILGGLAVLLLGAGSAVLVGLLQGAAAPSSAPGPLAGFSPALPAPAGSPTPPPPAPAQGAPAPNGARAAAMPRPAAPGRVSSRKHRLARGPDDLGGAPRETLATQLAAGLDGFRAQIEACWHAAAAGAGLGGGPEDGTTVIRSVVERSGLRREQMSEETARALRDLEEAVSRATAPRQALLLDVETQEGTARILDVSGGASGPDEDPLVACARRALLGKVLRVAAARAGGRVPVRFPIAR